jgi:hypothetical protein
MRFILSPLLATATLALAAGSAAAALLPPMGTQVDFQGIIAQAMAIYVPYMADQGVELRFRQDHQHMILAYAKRDDETHATFVVDDGYYTNTKVSEDGFRFVACHELGHIAASAPHMEAPAMYDGILDEKGDLLISAEGQADYFAAAKCMREMLVGEDNLAYVRALGAPLTVAAKCDSVYPDERESALCQRIMVAGKNFLDSFARSFASSFDAKDPSEPAYSRLGEHPSAQCRLDTVVAGALCPVSKDAAVDPYDPALGSCTSKNFPQGARPRCWFKE